MDSGRADLAVAYRVYPRVSPTPLVHADDKYALARTCLASFRRALGGLSVKIWAILDDCPPEYEALFRAHFREEDLALLRLPGVGNQATFAAQIDVLLAQTASERVFFAEDDYFYLPESLVTMLDFQGSEPQADFVTPYDHPDYSRLRLHDAPGLRALDERWRTVPTTCLTFLTTQATLRATHQVFRTYRHRRNLDASLWLSLTKAQVRSPRRALSLLRTEPASFKIVLKAWLYNAPQVVFGRRRRLWAPAPSLATHLDDRYPAPGVDWVRQIALTEEAGHADRD